MLFGLFYRILESNRQLGAAILLVWDNTPSLKSMKDILTAANNNRQRRVSTRDEYDDEEMDTEQSEPVSVDHYYRSSLHAVTNQISNLQYTLDITPNRVTSGEAHLRGWVTKLRKTLQQ